MFDKAFVVDLWVSLQESSLGGDGERLACFHLFARSKIKIKYITTKWYVKVLSSITKGPYRWVHLGEMVKVDNWEGAITSVFSYSSRFRLELA